MLPTEFTQYLNNYDPADKKAMDFIFSVIYEDLHNQAARLVSNEQRQLTLNTTALVHEAYLKLVDINEITWKSRKHFFNFASKAMRRILVDYARRRQASKRGSGAQAMSLEDIWDFANESAEYTVVSFDQSENILALDEALARLETFDKAQSQIVNLKFFGGRTNKETSDLLGVSLSTVKREWTTAKAWLRKEILKNC